MTECHAGNVVRSTYSARWTGVVISDNHGWIDSGGAAINPVYDNHLGPQHPLGHGRRVFFVDDGCVLVRVTKDRHGNGTESRKQMLKVIHRDWLEAAT